MKTAEHRILDKDSVFISTPFTQGRAAPKGRKLQTKGITPEGAANLNLEKVLPSLDRAKVFSKALPYFNRQKLGVRTCTFSYSPRPAKDPRRRAF
jgi:hypothetical protein